MSRLLWDQRSYELGVDRGVFYPQGSPGVPWNGLVSVTENPSESDSTSNFIDGRKMRQRRGMSEFSATLEAYTYPDEFEEYDGLVGQVAQQRRMPFGMSYRTMIGDDRYRIHLIYNALAHPTARNHTTAGENAEADTFSWDISTRPELFPGAAPTAHLYVESNVLGTTPLEDALYGTADSEPYLPSPGEVLEIFESAAILRITDNGDGTWTAEGPDSVITMLDDTTFEIDWPSAVFIGSETYTISSL